MSAIDKYAIFSDKPVLITGASSGIGFTCAQVLAQGGAGHLILTGRNPDRLLAAKGQLTAMAQVRVDTVACDQHKRSDMEALLTYLDDKGWPAALIANVGVNYVHQYGPKKMHNLDFDQIEEAITTNVTHTFYLLSTILGKMRSQRFGRIVLVGSQGWQHGLAGQALYNLSKSSLVGLTKSIVSEYSANRIFCHLMNPGVVLNDRTLALRKKHPQLAVQDGITEMDVAGAICGLLNVADASENGQELNL